MRGVTLSISRTERRTPHSIPLLDADLYSKAASA